MKTQEPHQPLPDDEDEVTLVAPRFDDEETIVARRVVPLEEVEHAAPAVAAVADARPDSRPSVAPRRPWLLALVFASSLVGGGVIGGAGLYFYQRRAAASPAPAAATEQSNVAHTTAPVAASQASPGPSDEVIGGQSNAPAQSQDSEAQTDESNARDDANGEERDASDETDAGAAVEQRKASGEGERVGAPKRGKKGEHDEEIQRNERRAGPDGQLSRADTDASTSDRHARHVDTIFERPRRAARREHARPDTAGDADRLRRIFEGQP